MALTFLPPVRTVWLRVAFLISLVPLVPRSHDGPAEVGAAQLGGVTSAAFRTPLT